MDINTELLLIKEKLILLTESYQKLSDENTVLKNQVEQFKNILLKKESELLNFELIDTSTEGLETFSISRVELAEIKHNISRQIAEIDKCIAWLNEID